MQKGFLRNSEKKWHILGCVTDISDHIIQETDYPLVSLSESYLQPRVNIPILMEVGEIHRFSKHVPRAGCSELVPSLLYQGGPCCSPATDGKLEMAPVPGALDDS